MAPVVIVPAPFWAESTFRIDDRSRINIVGTHLPVFRPFIIVVARTPKGICSAVGGEPSLGAHRGVDSSRWLVQYDDERIS